MKKKNWNTIFFPRPRRAAKKKKLFLASRGGMHESAYEVAQRESTTLAEAAAEIEEKKAEGDGVCVSWCGEQRERGRERGGEREREPEKHFLLFTKPTDHQPPPPSTPSRPCFPFPCTETCVTTNVTFHDSHLFRLP